MRPALAFSIALFAMGAFAILQGERTLTLEIEMSQDGERALPAVVYWHDGTGEMNEAASRAFEAPPGRHRLQVPIPAEARTLRIVPAREPGRAIEIHRLALYSYGVALRAWGGRRGFRDWYVPHGAEEVDATGGRLKLRSTAFDPRVESERLDVGRRRRALHAVMALASGVLLGFFHARVTAWLGTATPSADSRRLDPRTAALFVTATAVSGVASYLAYARWIEPRRITPPAFAEEYSTALYDTDGRPLSIKPAALRLVLDPFTGFRNLPNQKTAQVTIDARGYRGGSPVRAGRPKAVVLGGSTAFGHSLERDSDTVAAQLALLRPEWEWVNAGVIGHLSGQELAMMVHYADKLSPRLYVVLDGWNDQFAQAHPHARPGEYGYNWAIFGEINDRLFRLARREGLDASDAAPSRPSVDPAGIREAYASNLLKMAAFAKSRGAGLLVVLQPYLGNRRALSTDERHRLAHWREYLSGIGMEFDGGYAALVEHARRACTAGGVRVLDLYGEPQLRDLPETLFVDQVHLNARGHRLAAELIAPQVSAFAEAPPQ